MKKKFSILQPMFFIGCLTFLAGILCWKGGGTVQAADTVSREEWIHILSDTFQMKIEDGLVPDDYYTDVSENSSDYYTDIMTAVNFGVIDLEAGEEFCPKEAATREFAAQTLNFCLGYELEEDALYTMEDYEDLKYAQADQIAVEHGWFALIDNQFCPDRTITMAEKNQMINFAKQVLSSAEIDENHENTYEFAENVVVIPEETMVELGKNKVTIYDTEVNLSQGDIFAVFSNGIAYTYEAVSISSEPYGLEVETQAADYESAVTKYDAEGIIEADLGTFVPASDNIIMDVEYEEEGIASYANSRATKKIKDIKLSTNVGGGKIACNITSIQVNYKLSGGDYLFSVSGKATASYTISGKKSLTIPLGAVIIAGVGKIQISMVYSADGSAVLTLSSKFAAGVEKTGGSIRKIKNFTTPSWHFSAKAELRAACKVSFEIAIPAIADGNVYAEIGVKSTPDIEVYSDGRKPVTCMDLPAYLYATAGYSVNVVGHQVARDTIYIYTASNSPVKVCFHIEDGKEVSVCSRLDSSSHVGKRGYYSLWGAVGTYGSECFIAPYEEVKIFDYELDDAGHATITKYYGNVYALTIPEELDGYPVTAIGEEAFKGNTSLGSVVIPNAVESIGKEAFADCSSLADVILPENSKYTAVFESVFANTVSLNHIEIPKYITEIQKRAFYNCGLTVMHLSEDITYIGEEAFYGCAKLSDLVLPKYMEKYGAACFGDCDALRSVEIFKYLKENDYFPDYHAMVDNGVMRGMFYDCDNLKEVRFASGVTRIASNLFNGCTGLEEITIPDTVTHIGLHAFNACTSLRTVNMPESLTKIDVMAFRKCTALESIYIPDSVTEIWGCAFSGCDKLSEVHLPEKLKILGTWAFDSCVSLKTITIPPNVAEVPQYYNGFSTFATESPFTGCAKLKEVVLEEGTQKIAGFLFKNCTSLEEITVPDSVMEIGESAFSDASSLKTIILSKNLMNINEKAFANCSLLEKIELPDTIKAMGNNVFANCSLLSEVKLPKYGVGIPSGTFKNCTSLKMIDFPEHLQYIYSNAFEGCEKLESITLPDEFKGIESSAFLNCKRLTSAELKGDYIGQGAFANCMELTDVKMSDSISIIGNSAFLNCTNIENLHISTGLEQIEANVFGGCTFLDNLVIPYGVTDIGNEAFKNCTKLKSISISESVTSISENAFSYPEEVTVYGVKGSYAEEYAKSHNMIFVEQTTAVAELNFLKESYVVRVWQNVKAAVSILPETSNAKLTWTSSDENIATVVNGTVTGVKAGECTITVKAGNIEKSCKIIVKDEFYCFTVTGKEKMQVGETQQLVCKDDEEKAMDAKEFRWWSSNPNVATVDQEGNLSAVKKGKVSIEVWFLEDTQRESKIEIEVLNVGELIPVEGVIIIPPKDMAENQQVEIGETFTLSAVVTPSDATEQEVDWNSSDEGVAEITEEGVVTTFEVGKVTFTATSKDGGKQARFTIQVIEESTHTHFYQNQITTQPSCTTAGVRTYTCSGCGDSYTETIAAIGHKYTKATTPSTCTAKGTIIHTCSVCKHNYTEEIAATGHKAVKDTAVAATCTKAGKTEGSHCSVCNAVIVKQNTVVATGHKAVSDAAVAATCTKTGKTKGSHCSVCKTVIVKQKIVAATGHSYRTNIVAATTSKNGRATTACKKCGKKKTDTVIYAIKTVKLSKDSFTCTGKSRKPSVVIKDRRGKKLKNKKDYTVSYPKSAKNVGSYNVQIKFKGNYRGKIKEIFTVIPKSTSISKVTPEKNGFSVKWKKQANQTTGYEIAYSTDSKFKKGTKIVTVKKNKTVSESILKLKAKKKYYVRIRTYKTVKGKKYYSEWSKVKNITTKK